MPLPTFTEEDYRRAEKEMKAKNKGKKEESNYAAAADGRVYRSLHHIDDDEVYTIPDRTKKSASKAPKLKDDAPDHGKNKK
jgi:hypothetical protein